MEALNNSQRAPDKNLETRKKILAYISANGPCMPIKISQHTGLSMLFSSAFLSELLSEKLLKISIMRIGSSPLYFMPGQEKQLVNFENYVKGREREAYDLLKAKGVLRDSELEPAIRVALRSIKDFSFPLIANLDGQQILFWRFLTLDEEEAKKLISEILEGWKSEKKEVRKEEKIELKKEEKEIKLEVKPEEKKIEQVEEKKEARKEEKAEEIKEDKKQEKTEEKPKKVRALREKKEKTIDTRFLELVKSYLKTWDIEFLEGIEIDKKELLLKTRINSDIGKVEVLAVCKDKKKIMQDDVIVAVQKAQSYKMPGVLITTGELHKKALEESEKWGNLLKIKRIKFK